MIFPLYRRKVIRGFQDHINAKLSGATDYEASYQKLYAPCGGTLYAFGGPRDQGGYWLGLKSTDGVRIEFAHLSKRLKLSGKVKEGDLIGVTGNSGTLTSGPHLHVQVLDSKNNRVDPEQFFFAKDLPMAAVNMTVAQMQAIKDEVINYSAGMLEINWYIKDSPIFAPVGDLGQETSYGLIDQLGIKDRFVIMRYDAPTAAFLKTYYYPKNNQCLSTIPNTPLPRSCVFELAHNWQTWYNENRGVLPYIEVVDSNFPSDDLIIEKLRTIIPYVSILNKPL